MPVLFLLVVQVANGQYYAVSEAEEVVHKSLSVKFHRGIVLPFHDDMIYMLKDFSNGVELNYGSRNFSKNSWQANFNYPEIGLGLYYGTLGNDEIYGSGIALFPYINQYIYRSTRFSAEYKSSLGLAYVTKIYDYKTNPYNSCISSHVNAYIGFGLLLDYRITDRIVFNATASLTHFSNGAVKKPNYGINILSTTIGAKYMFNEKPTPVIDKIKVSKSKEQEILVVVSCGQSQHFNNTSKYYNVNLNVNYLWHLNSKKAIGIGFDEIYSKSIPYIWANFEEESYSSFSNSDYFVSSVFASYNIFLGKATAYIHLGAYVFSNIQPVQPVYPRIGVRYRITDNLVSSLGVKASFCASEFLEFGVGYRFNVNRNNHE